MNRAARRKDHLHRREDALPFELNENTFLFTERPPYESPILKKGHLFARREAPRAAVFFFFKPSPYLWLFLNCPVKLFLADSAPDYSPAGLKWPIFQKGPGDVLGG